MSDFSNFSWKEIDKFLIDYGCTFVRQKGSHRIYKKAGVTKLLTLPEHKTISTGVLLQIIRNLGMDKETFSRRISNI